MAHSYANLYGLPCTGLRFFTVYGPWGRPDMALFKFTGASSRVGRSRCSTRAACCATSPTSTTSSRASCASWPSRRRRSGVVRRAAGPRDEPGALSHLQHRQQPAGEADAVYRGARAVPGQEGEAELPPDAAGRRARHAGRRRRAGARLRLPAADDRRGGRRPLRGVVPRRTTACPRERARAGATPWIRGRACRIPPRRVDLDGTARSRRLGITPECGRPWRRPRPAVCESAWRRAGCGGPRSPGCAPSAPIPR